MATTGDGDSGSDRSDDRARVVARQRAGVWRTFWICVAVVVVLLGSFLAQHML